MMMPMSMFAKPFAHQRVSGRAGGERALAMMMGFGFNPVQIDDLGGFGVTPAPGDILTIATVATPEANAPAPTASTVLAPTPSNVLTTPTTPTLYRCWDGSMAPDPGQCPPPHPGVAPTPTLMPSVVVQQLPLAPSRLTVTPSTGPQPTVHCWDGSLVLDPGQCPPQPTTPPPTLYRCWDGSLASELRACPARYQGGGPFPCWDGSIPDPEAGIYCPPDPRTQVPPDMTEREVHCWDGSIVLDPGQCPPHPSTDDHPKPSPLRIGPSTVTAVPSGLLSFKTLGLAAVVALGVYALSTRGST